MPGWLEMAKLWAKAQRKARREAQQALREIRAAILTPPEQKP